MEIELISPQLDFDKLTKADKKSPVKQLFKVEKQDKNNSSSKLSPKVLPI